MPVLEKTCNTPTFSVVKPITVLLKTGEVMGFCIYQNTYIDEERVVGR
jgi:hypothetical protein